MQNLTQLQFAVKVEVERLVLCRCSHCNQTQKMAN